MQVVAIYEIVKRQLIGGIAPMLHVSILLKPMTRRHTEGCCEK